MAADTSVHMTFTRRIRFEFNQLFVGDAICVRGPVTRKSSRHPRARSCADGWEKFCDCSLCSVRRECDDALAGMFVLVL